MIIVVEYSLECQILLHAQAKHHRSRNMKFKYALDLKVQYWLLADQGQGHGETFSIDCHINSQSCNSTLVHARNLIHLYVYVIIIYKVNEYRHP